MHRPSLPLSGSCTDLYRAGSWKGHLPAFLARPLPDEPRPTESLAESVLSSSSPAERPRRPAVDEQPAAMTKSASVVATHRMAPPKPAIRFPLVPAP